MSSPETRLVNLIVDAAVRRKRGEAVPDQSEHAARLVVEVGARGVGAFERFFAQLVTALKAHGLGMPSFDELPPAIAPFAAAFGSAIVTEPTGDIDMEATAEALDAKLEETLGASPRKLRDDQLREKIRRTMAAGTAEAMRRHGLVPVADMPPDDDDDDA